MEAKRRAAAQRVPAILHLLQVEDEVFLYIICSVRLYAQMASQDAVRHLSGILR